MLDKTLEIGRGLAAMAVFLFHLRPSTNSIPWVDQIAARGSSGVTLFFVISGYCMYAAASSTRRREMSAWSFLKRRLRRIFPPLWASMLVVILLPFLLEALSSIKTGRLVSPTLGWSAWTWRDWALAASLLRVLLAPKNDLQAAFSDVNSVYWTLAIEVQFYLVVAASICLRDHWRLALLVVSIVCLFPVSTELSPAGLFVPYWSIFAIGLALRWLHESGWHAEALFGNLSCFTALGGIIVFYFVAGRLMDTSALAFAFGVAVILWLSSGIEKPVERLLNSHSLRARVFRFPLLVAVFLGASSYSLYLLHGKLYQLPAMFVRQFFDINTPAFLVLVVLLTSGLAYLFFLVFERPFMSGAYRDRIADQNSIKK